MSSTKKLIIDCDPNGRATVRLGRKVIDVIENTALYELIDCLLWDLERCNNVRIGNIRVIIEFEVRE